MLTFTDAALKHIAHSLKSKGPGAAFRLSVKETGCSGYMYVIDIVSEKKNNTDIEIQTPLFMAYLDVKAAPIVQGTTVDYVQKKFGFEQLSFDNPHAEGLCGCGESFKIRNRSTREA